MLHAAVTGASDRYYIIPSPESTVTVTTVLSLRLLLL
jgi:hypothetical protein